MWHYADCACLLVAVRNELLRHARFVPAEIVNEAMSLVRDFHNKEGRAEPESFVAPNDRDRVMRFRFAASKVLRDLARYPFIDVSPDAFQALAELERMW